MKYPYLQETNTKKEMTTFFAGLNQTVQCQEGEFESVKNITTQYYPTLSVRNKRGYCKTFTNLQGVLDKESLIWIDNRVLYVDGVAKSLKSGVSITDGKKDIYKMAAYIIIMPDKIWINVDNGESGYIDAVASIPNGRSVSFTLCDSFGNAVTWHDPAYYESNKPKDGDYMMNTGEGKSSLRVYSAVTSMWTTVTTTYMKIQSSGIGNAFEKDDGVKIYVNNSSARWSYADKIFVNKESDGRLSLNALIYDKGADYITIPAMLNENKTFTNLPMSIERKMPEVSFMTECQNRMWACSKDGHEIYCCKLGDVRNWNYFTGVSIDSYAATVGSDGKFTGATTYNLNPIFFKEDTWLKVSVSANGAHSYREQPERGLQSGSEKSICLINGVLYYKGVNCVYAYDGSSPQKVSDKLGEHRYSEAIGGTIDGRYYLSMKGSDGKRCLYTYDTKAGLWAAEDEINIDYFCKHKAELYMVSNNKLISVCGTSDFGSVTKEDDVKWEVVSGKIGFALDGNKYVDRINVRLSLDLFAYMDFYIEYDTDGVWHHCFNLSGKGTKSFVIPVIPTRCDHFRYKIVGKGGCKIYSITKTIEEGSDGL